MDRVKRIWYLSPMRAAKVQASLRIRAISPEPSLLAHTSSESRGTFRQKARSLAPLNGWACAVKVYHDGMLEDTNSLDGAQMEKKLMVLLFIFLYNAKFLAYPTTFSNDFVLHERKTHRQNRHSKQNIDGAKNQLRRCLRIIKVSAWYHVPKAYGGECDKAEICRLKPIPSWKDKSNM